MIKQPGLFVVATPIGNLGDMSLRAVDILKAADVILCEDTRQTAKLCVAYSITTPRQPYHDHNGAQVRPAIIERLTNGAMIALVSDAGTPLISDPGYKLVRDARAGGIEVTSAPGPSAVIAALSIAGLPSDQFFFAGFAPGKQAARESFLTALKPVPGTLVFYETASRLTDMLQAVAIVLGDRPVYVARELTKLHEEIITGSARSLAEQLASANLKGEIVLLVQAQETGPVDEATLDAFLARHLPSVSVKEAARLAADELKVPRHRAYQRALALKAGSP